jgi:nucleoside-diphosphate-sugar epimerase
VSSISTDDAATAVVAALTAPGGIYNVTDDHPVTKAEYVSGLARALAVADPRFFPVWSWRLAGSVGDSLRRAHRISNAKFKRVTGWSPIHTSVVGAWPEVVNAMRQS